MSDLAGALLPREPARPIAGGRPHAALAEGWPPQNGHPSMPPGLRLTDRFGEVVTPRNLLVLVRLDTAAALVAAHGEAAREAAMMRLRAALKHVLPRGQVVGSPTPDTLLVLASASLCDDEFVRRLLRDVQRELVAMPFTLMTPKGPVLLTLPVSLGHGCEMAGPVNPACAQGFGKVWAEAHARLAEAPAPLSPDRPAARADLARASAVLARPGSEVTARTQAALVRLGLAHWVELPRIEAELARLAAAPQARGRATISAASLAPGLGGGALAWDSLRERLGTPVASRLTIAVTASGAPLPPAADMLASLVVLARSGVKLTCDRPAWGRGLALAAPLAALVELARYMAHDRDQ